MQARAVPTAFRGPRQAQATLTAFGGSKHAKAAPTAFTGTQRAKAALAALIGLSVVSSGAFGQRGNDDAPADRCESTTCFNQLQIRRVEVIDPTSLLVFVGGQECAFFVEFTGTFCDLTFLPPQSVVFRPSRLGRARAAPIVGGPGTAADGGGPIEQTRICDNDINMGLEAGPFTTSVSDADDGGSGLSCRIESVRSLTDDERLQIYVDNELSVPPPPFGTGRVEAPENPEEPEAQPVEEDDSRSRRRRRRDRDADDD